MSKYYNLQQEAFQATLYTDTDNNAEQVTDWLMDLGAGVAKPDDNRTIHFVYNLGDAEFRGELWPGYYVAYNEDIGFTVCEDTFFEAVFTEAESDS